MEHCADPIHDLLLQPSQDASLKDIVSLLPSYSTSSNLHEIYPALGAASARFMAGTFCNGHLPSPPPDFPFSLSLVPPLEDYIIRLLRDLPWTSSLNISIYTIFFLGCLRRIFPRARTVAPHGLYLATFLCATKYNESSALEGLRCADKLFSLEVTKMMEDEVARLLGSSLRQITIAELMETWHTLCSYHPDLQYTAGPVDAAMPCGDGGGDVAAVPTWSRLLCEERSFSGECIPEADPS